MVATKEKDEAISKKSTALPEGYKPSMKEKYMNELQLEFFRQKLLSWKEDLIKESRETIDGYLKEQNMHEPDDTDSAWQETDATFQLRKSERHRKLIDKINAALARIDEGEYGYCEETGEEIGVRRLEARPIATLCIEAQERHENYERSHIDEDDVE